MERLRQTRSNTGLIQLIGIIVAGFSGVGAAVGDHLANSNCAACHIAGNGTNPFNAHLLTGTQEILCGDCHENSLHIGHPTAFVPNRLLPIEYPLDWKGSFTCSTCHDTHSSTPNLLYEQTTGMTLCLKCHDIPFFSQMADQGLSLVQVHLTLQPIDPQTSIDSYSLHCASCHDDKISTKVGSGFNAAVNSSINHSVGVDYNLAASQERYHTLAELDTSMTLPYGYVSCVSCHQGYSSAHGNLNISNVGSALCYECHDI